MIIGNKTILRAWSGDDLPILQSLRNNLELQLQLMARPKGNSIEQVKEWLTNKTKSSDSLLFIVADKSSNQVAGYIQISKIDPFNGTGWLGICISPDMQGQGYGSEAIRLIEAYLLEVMLLRKLVLEVLAKNKSARRLYARLGFSEIGSLRAHFYIDHAYGDVLLMEKFIRV